MMRVSLLGLTCALLLMAAEACSRKQVSIPTPPATLARNDKSYVDLEPGSTLRIVLPLLKSGDIRSNLTPDAAQGNTMSLRADNLIGYATVRYAIVGRKGAGVRLKFLSAEETKKGTTAPLQTAPLLPFELPRKTENIRLIFLVRVSQADHNMAIAGSRHMESLNAFTTRLKEDPSVCKTTGDILCSWVPAGVAVRPETGGTTR